MTAAEFHAQAQILEGALGLSSISTDRPFGGNTNEDRIHMAALVAFAKQQSSIGTSVNETIESLRDTIKNCGPNAFGTQLAIFGTAAVVQNDAWYSGVIYTLGVNIAASGLKVDTQGCLLQVDQAGSFSSTEVILFVNTGSTAVGVTPVSCPSNKLTFSTGGRGDAYFARPGAGSLGGRGVPAPFGCTQ